MYARGSGLDNSELSIRSWRRHACSTKTREGFTQHDHMDLPTHPTLRWSFALDSVGALGYDGIILVVSVSHVFDSVGSDTMPQSVVYVLIFVVFPTLLLVVFALLIHRFGYAPVFISTGVAVTLTTMGLFRVAILRFLCERYQLHIEHRA